MSLLEAKKEYSKRGHYDECYTPAEAVRMLFPYIPENAITVWECTAIADSKIVQELEKEGYIVEKSHINEGLDFFKHEPGHYDMIITNPPYSKKEAFIERCKELGKPFMLLLPTTALEGKKRGKLFEDFIQVLVPNKRFNFQPDKGSSAWFHTSWFCGGCDLPRDLIFVDLDKPTLKIQL